MGNSCSSGQAHKDKDNASQHSEESPSYRITKPSIDATAEAAAAAADAAAPDSTLLEPAASVRERRGVGGGAPAVVARGPRVIGSSVSDSISLSSPVAAASPRELEPTLVPPSVAALPEELRGALLGRTPAASAPPRRPPRRNKAMIIYVCAADSQDCCSEKGALQCGAALRLRARARRRGWRLHVADLHWRSPLEQQRDHRFPVLCTTELARQAELGAVVPVLFLNSGLGTPLLPHTLEAADFRAALDAAATDHDRALLNKWYSMDATAEPPCYRLARGAPARWRREMARALAVLVRALPQEACDAYLTTVVEQEVHNTVLMSTEQARRCIWVCRSGAGAAGAAAGGADCADDGADSTEPGDAAGQHELQRRLANLQRDLKQHLCERNIIRASLRGCGGSGGGGAEGAEYTAGVRTALGERLDALIDALAAEYDAPAGYQGVPASLFEELTEQLTFCQQAAQSTSTREHTLNEIKAYVCGDSTVPLVLLGGAGSGKATLLARTLTLAPTWQPDVAVLLRFVGLTAQSSSSHQLLKSLVDQLHVLHDGSIYRGRNNVASLTVALGRLLAVLGRCRPLLLALAGAGALRGARWLPATLPDNVKMILTLTEEADEPASSAVLAVLVSETGPRVLRVPPPSAEEARAVLAACAAHYPRTGGAALPSPRALAAIARCTTPLYAKVVAWQCSLSMETFAEQDANEAAAAAAAEVEAVASAGEEASAELETQLVAVLAAAERALGAARVSAALALLTAARRGLDDTELLDLLAHDPLFRSEETYLPWAPASLFWPQLAALLGSFLRWDGRGAARWRDAALAAVARERYLAECEREVRERLVQYYEGVWYEENDPKMAGRLISQDNKFSEDCYNTRKLDELPYQHYHLSRHDPGGFAHRPYFTDASWIYDKIAATDCTAYLADLELVSLRPPPEHVLVLRDLLEAHSPALDYDVRQFYGLLRLTLERRARSASPALQSDVCNRWLQLAREPPIPTLVAGGAGAGLEAEAPSRRAPGTPPPPAAGAFHAKSYELVVRLGGRHVAAVSAEREEICVWDVVACRKVRTLRGVTHPTNLVPVDRHKCVVLCRRELRLYDLEKGQFLVALKGVMNQKMPYYGLHDEHHLVALSRNRMYVNLMHMDTGDLVTTFKAGEDRFLNSLLVSGDGRILVCGDETQKPFPLLVWGLSSRKLLYDLRIPHHEFLTHLAAITHEGSYVCVVSRELDEPSPNFIVVYDLQSGTLFKKWKPGCDTAALAISSADGCVVSGLADARILVWDLLTGNCRLTLRGHVAAPSLLRLARTGGVLLSADAAARDLSVRLWDLTKGKLIAVYTPPERACACEVAVATAAGAGGGALAVAALALESRRELVPLRLEGPAPDAVRAAAAAAAAADDGETYGAPERDGAVFELRDSGPPAS